MIRRSIPKLGSKILDFRIIVNSATLDSDILTEKSLTFTFRELSSIKVTMTKCPTQPKKLSK